MMSAKPRLEHIEFGSFYEGNDLRKRDLAWFDPSTATLSGSGRDALYAILKTLTEKKVRDLTIWIPSYYCHPITEAVGNVYPVRIYQSPPFEKTEISERLTDKDVLILVEYFGCESLTRFHGDPIVVLDKTHNPIIQYQYDFAIDYSFGSLRKILPVADGGFIFKCSSKVPSIDELPLTDKHKSVVLDVRKAMSLKKDYLEVKAFTKECFLRLFQKSESAWGDVRKPSGSAISRELSVADIQFYLCRRKENNELLKCLILERPKALSVIEDDLFFVLKCDSPRVRDDIRDRLISDDIYPAVLWPIDERYMSTKDIEFSATTLVLPTDFRYDKSCIELLAQRINKVIDELKYDY